MILRELINLIGYEIDETAYREVEGRSKALFEGIKSFGAEMSLKVTAPLTAFALHAVNEFTEMKTAVAIVSKTIESMGNVSGQTAKGLEAMANGLSNNSLFKTEQVLQDVTGTLLTFENVTSDVFSEASQGAVDLAARWKMDLTSASIMVGKALNDPAEGLGMLTRRYVHMTKAETDHIKALVDAGRKGEAQRFILDAINRSVGGMAKTVRDSSSGFIVFKNKMDDVAQTFGEILQPYIKKFYEGLVKILDKIQQLSPETKKALIIFGAFAAVIGPLALFLSTMGLALSGIVKGIAAVSTAMRTLGVVFGVTGGVALGEVLLIVAAIVALFLIVDDFMNYMKGADSVIGRFLEPWMTLGPKIMEGLQPLIYWLKLAFTGIVELARGVVQILVGLFTGNGDMFINGLKNIIKGVLDLVYGLLSAISDVVGNLIKGILKIVWDGLMGIPAYIKSMLDSVVNAVKSVPFLGDFVKGIGAMGRGLMNPSTNTNLNNAAYSAGASLFAPKAGATGATNKNINVQSTIAMTVPAGTQAQQIQAVKSAAEQAVRTELNNHLRSAYLQVAQ